MKAKKQNLFFGSGQCIILRNYNYFLLSPCFLDEILVKYIQMILMSYFLKIFSYLNVG